MLNTALVQHTVLLEPWIFFIQAVIINKSFFLNFNKKFLPSNLSILKQVDFSLLKDISKIKKYLQAGFGSIFYERIK